MKYLTRCLLFLLVIVNADAQHESHQKSRGAKLIPGMGRVHHPVTTANPEAQRYFDQGLALIYGFNHEEAGRSFLQAARLDPQLAIAHWGYSLAVGFNYNEPAIDPIRMKQAVGALSRATELFPYASDAEKAYINALKRRFSLDPKADVKALSRAYSEAMASVARDFPDDPDAATLYADSLMNLNPWQLWTRDGQPAPGTEIIVRVLEDVLRRHPDHLGANHLYIHAVEASQNPEKALASAARLPSLAPAAGHLVHMPGHIYLRTGDYEKSALTNVAAAAADRRYLKTGAAGPTYGAMYFSHNLDFQVQSFGGMGRFREAQRAALELQHNIRRHIKHMPMVEGFLPSPVFTLLRFGKWNAMLDVREPEGSKLARVAWLFARSYALASKGQTLLAENERRDFLAALSALPPETPFGLNSARSVFLIAERLLDARIARSRNDWTEAVRSLRLAVEAQDALNYDEPPDWYYPVRESLGAALLLSGSAVEAERVFRDDLTRNPRNGRSLFGLAESLRKQGKNAASRLVRREFEVAWRKADVRLRLEDL